MKRTSAPAGDFLSGCSGSVVVFIHLTQLLYDQFVFEQLAFAAQSTNSTSCVGGSFGSVPAAQNFITPTAAFTESGHSAC